jgi:hypothetical protein
MASVAVTALDPATCANGHEINETNTRWYPDTKRGGAMRRYCQPCRTAAAQRSRDRKAELDAAVIGPPGDVRTIWSQLSVDLRWRIGGILLSPPAGTEEVVLLVVRAAAERQCWYRSGPDAAARMFVEALLESTIDARSSALRIENLLGLVFGPR